MNACNQGKGQGEIAESRYQTDCERNPLLNPVVLVKLFEVCELCDLRRFRQVCKLWLSLSLPRWRKEITIVMPRDLYESQESSLSTRKKLNLKTMSVLHETRSISEKPFSKFSLHWNMTKESMLHLDQVRSSPEEEKNPDICMGLFWRNCGPWIHSLDMILSISCVNSFKKVIFAMTPNLKRLSLGFMLSGSAKRIDADDEVLHINPNLQYLKLNFRNKHCMPFSWRQFFLHFPNLKEFKMTRFCISHMLKDIADELEQLVREGHKVKIERFHLCCLYDSDADAIERLLEIPERKPVRLIVKSPFHDQYYTFLPKIIQLHSSKLERLDLFHSVQNDEEEIPAFPLFPFQKQLLNLTSLTLSSKVTNILDFLQYTPNLKILHITGKRIGIIIHADNVKKLEALVLPQMHEFRIDSSHSQNLTLFPADIEIFGSCMPNLKVLRMPLTPEAFRSVCQNQHWKDLRTFHIDSEIMDDDYLTGIVSGSSIRLPNITDLKHLGSFFLTSKLLTDKSIYDGFLKMYNLYNLSVTMSAQTSNEAFTALCSRFPSTLISRCESDNEKQKEVDVALRLKAEMWEKDFGSL